MSYYFLLIYTVIGFIQHYYSGVSLAQLYMGFFLFLLFLQLLKLSYNEASVILILFVYFLFTSNFVGLINGNFENVFSKFVLLQKFIFTVVSYYYFINLFKKGYFYNNKKFFKANVFALFLIMLISLTGYGAYAYGASVGIKGFFRSGNELSFAILLLIGNLLFYVWRFNNKIFLMVSVFSLLVAFLFGMKVLIFGVILLIVFLAFKKTSMIKGLGFLILILTGGIAFFFLFQSLTDPVLLRFVFKYGHSDTILEFLLSQRDMSLIKNWNLYQDTNIWQLLFGMSQPNYTEMDFFSIIFNFGLVGLFIIYGFYLIVIINSWKKAQKEYRSYFLFFNLLIIITSMVAGHFVFSALAGFFFAYSNALVYKKNVISHKKYAKSSLVTENFI